MKELNERSDYLINFIYLLIIFFRALAIEKLKNKFESIIAVRGGNLAEESTKC
jgi:hypothetical protein